MLPQSQRLASLPIFVPFGRIQLAPIGIKDDSFEEVPEDEDQVEEQEEADETNVDPAYKELECLVGAKLSVCDHNGTRCPDA